MWEYEETAQRLLRGEIESDEHHAASAHGEADKVTKEQRGWARD